MVNVRDSINPFRRFREIYDSNKRRILRSYEMIGGRIDWKEYV